jgi:predicted esterase
MDRKLPQYELTQQNRALVGFSQGTMMVLHVSFHRRGKGHEFKRGTSFLPGLLFRPDVRQTGAMMQPPNDRDDWHD